MLENTCTIAILTTEAAGMGAKYYDQSFTSVCVSITSQKPHLPNFNQIVRTFSCGRCSFLRQCNYVFPVLCHSHEGLVQSWRATSSRARCSSGVRTCTYCSEAADVASRRHRVHYRKRWRHPQSQKYINVSQRRGPSYDCTDNMHKMAKFGHTPCPPIYLWCNTEVWLTDTQTDRQTDTLRRHTPRLA